MTEKHTGHNYATANAEHFSERARSYRTELLEELARRCATSIQKIYPFDVNTTEVLDFACGPGLVAFELLPYTKRIVGVDSAQGMVDVFNHDAQKKDISLDKIYCVKIDSLKGDQSDVDGQLFDVVICVQAYHHFEDPAHITKALAQRLKPKGRLIVIDFADDEGTKTILDRKREGAHIHTVAHKHGFSFEQMTDMFKSAGLQDIHAEYGFKISKSEMKSYQGHELFGKALDGDDDISLQYFVAHGEKPL
ncbi:unnamed protein product [Adineta steineri]|uniref:Uncharacterized protein n=1 Tax=Adineta steineri TaxID=433720 RepID=A0A818TSP9_9BILA|nr:unnamed protein product [Adineta steineri]